MVQTFSRCKRGQIESWGMIFKSYKTQGFIQQIQKHDFVGGEYKTNKGLLIEQSHFANKNNMNSQLISKYVGRNLHIFWRMCTSRPVISYYLSSDRGGKTNYTSRPDPSHKLYQSGKKIMDSIWSAKMMSKVDPMPVTNLIERL